MKIRVKLLKIAKNYKKDCFLKFIEITEKMDLRNSVKKSEYSREKFSSERERESERERGRKIEGEREKER